MSTIRDVARAAGVSVATVSRALTTPEKVSEASLQRVREAVASTGYRPNLLARNFRSARSYSIVVLLPDITNPFFSEVIQGIEDSAQQQGYAVLLGDTRELEEREQDYIHRVETRLADGVIQLRPHTLASNEHNIPWVNSCGCESTPGPSIRVDNVGAAAQITDYLLDLGHTRIGTITGLEANPHTVERLAGFRQALDRRGIPVRPEFIFEGDFTLVSGQRAALSLLEREERPTALVCMSDQMAMGAIQALRGRGIRVPEDISVVGFDDIYIAQFWEPGLTTIAQPSRLLGQLSFDALYRILNGEDLHDLQTVVPVRLVERASAAPPQGR